MRFSLPSPSWRWPILASHSCYDLVESSQTQVKPNAFHGCRRGYGERGNTAADHAGFQSSKQLGCKSNERFAQERETSGRVEIDPVLLSRGRDMTSTWGNQSAIGSVSQSINPLAQCFGMMDHEHDFSWRVDRFGRGFAQMPCSSVDPALVGRGCATALNIQRNTFKLYRRSGRPDTA